MQPIISPQRNLGVVHATLLVIVLTLAQSLAAQTGDHYDVSTSGDDSSAGTIAAPWRTIQHAANTVAAGATVYVFGGV